LRYVELVSKYEAIVVEDKWVNRHGSDVALLRSTKRKAVLLALIVVVIS
jgi:hypothetical protein